MKIGLIGCGRFGKRLENRVCREFKNIEDYLGHKLNVKICGGEVEDNSEGFDQLIIVANCADYDGCSEAAQLSITIDRNRVIADILGLVYPSNGVDLEAAELNSIALRQGPIPMSTITPELPIISDQDVMHMAVLDLIVHRLAFLKMCNPGERKWLEDILAISAAVEALGYA
jgi:hypothetical protein